MTWIRSSKVYRIRQHGQFEVRSSDFQEYPPLKIPNTDHFPFFII
jgi:hypothetical protein